MHDALLSLDLEEKVGKAREVVEKAMEDFSRCVVAFTGGKDSTLMLWIIRRAYTAKGREVPELMFIDEGCVFEEALSFSREISKKWGLRLRVVRNDDVMGLVSAPGDVVKVADLNETNRRELHRLGFKGEEFLFDPESLVCNHLLKTVAMNEFIKAEGVDAVFTGIRWDEHEARAGEVFFSPREEPRHVRVHPILHFRERDVWKAVKMYGIPVNPLYAQGYRSLGARGTTSKISDKPAWEQDLESTRERAGRRQDKENIMRRLRDLGYM
jgi:phosphoadenosine phosphosulfate reductase